MQNLRCALTLVFYWSSNAHAVPRHQTGNSTSSRDLPLGALEGSSAGS